MFGIGWISVLVAGIVSVGAGLFWYGPLFGKKWMELTGVEENIGYENRIIKSVVALGLELLRAGVLAYLIALTGSYALPVLISIVFWIWVGFQIPILASNVFGEKKPPLLLIINAAYSLLSLLLMGLIIVLWTVWF